MVPAVVNLKWYIRFEKKKNNEDESERWLKTFEQNEKALILV